MTEGTQPGPQPEPEEQRAEMAGLPEVADQVREAMESLVYTARVDAAFGEAYTVGDRTIIPVAKVGAGGGFGVGSGQGPSPQGGQAGGGGGGGGGGGMATPVAIVVVTPEDVRVQPVLDLTQIALAGIATAAFNMFWLTRLLRGHKAMDKGEAAIKPPKLMKWLKF